MILAKAKFKHDGTRQARRVLPGTQIEFVSKGVNVRDTVESVFLFGEDRLIFNTVSGFRIPARWNERFDVWVREA